MIVQTFARAWAALVRPSARRPDPDYVPEMQEVLLRRRLWLAVLGFAMAAMLLGLWWAVR